MTLVLARLVLEVPTESAAEDVESNAAGAAAIHHAVANAPPKKRMSTAEETQLCACPAELDRAPLASASAPAPDLVTAVAMATREMFLQGTTGGAAPVPRAGATKFSESAPVMSTSSPSRTWTLRPSSVNLCR